MRTQPHAHAKGAILPAAERLSVLSHSQPGRRLLHNTVRS